MLTAKQDNIEVPAYDLMHKGATVGLITDFPMDGVVFTLRFEGMETTCYTETTVQGALVEARIQWAQFEAGTHQCQEPAPEWIEDEDGELAYEQMMERRAEDWAMRDPAYGTEYY